MAHFNAMLNYVEELRDRAESAYQAGRISLRQRCRVQTCCSNATTALIDARYSRAHYWYDAAVAELNGIIAE